MILTYVYCPRLLLHLLAEGNRDLQASTRRVQISKLLFLHQQCRGPSYQLFPIVRETGMFDLWVVLTPWNYFQLTVWIPNRSCCLFSRLTNEVDPDVPYFKAGAGLFCQMYRIVLTFDSNFFHKQCMSLNSNILVIKSGALLPREQNDCFINANTDPSKKYWVTSFCVPELDQLAAHKTRRNVYVHCGKLGQRFC